MKRILLALLASLSTLAAEPPPPAGKQTPLFGGKTLDGWDYDPKIWRVEDGMMTGGSLTEKIRENYFICTKKSYQNFDLTLKIKCAGDPATGLINSGIQVRSVRVPGGAHMSGYQVDCGKGWFGKIYDEFRRNKVIAEPLDAAALDKAVDVYGWNEYRIIAQGPRIRVWINGVASIDYTESDPNIALDGQIGPQVHSGGACLVQVKDVTIQELPPTPNAPTWEKVGMPGGKKPNPAAKPKKDPNAYNGGNSGPKTPAEQLATFKLPDGLEMELVAAEIPEMGVGKFVAVYFDQKGAMWTMTALEYPVDGNENAAAADALYKSKAKDKILVYDRDPKSPTGFVSKPRVFADGLAIPLGILPYKDGCYVQHGHDLVLLRDTDGDGKSDKREIILTGLGVQDSHLFPHQFTRAPGGWIWMAQGLFNNSKPQKPGDPKAVDWKQCSMAKMRMDGSQFEVTSTGPNNIWGLAMTAEGETFIQEANDYGYPVMPFHEYAYYPGGMEAHRKSYQPDFPPQADFRMGGTGLSGLALTDKDGIFPDGWRDVMLVANPITNRIQTIKMHRDGPRWRLEKLGDIVETTDSWFRPVALTLAPDGCVYVVDWYNKIISHNEVPRAHPDRDKTRGRIWRIKPKGKALMDVPDFTKASGDELIAELGGASVAQHHLAWQAIVDRGMKDLAPKLKDVVGTGKIDGARIGALWALVGLRSVTEDSVQQLLTHENRNVRREAVRSFDDEASGFSAAIFPSKLAASILSMAANPEEDPEFRAQIIQIFGSSLGAAKMSPPPPGKHGQTEWEYDDKRIIKPLLLAARPPLAEPTAKASHGNKTIKVGEAYEREFERFLVRMFLERHPDAVAKFLDTDDAKKLPLEARLLASLALEPKASASRVAALLPQLTRPPEKEEILRLVQFLDEPGVADAVKATLGNPATAPGVLAALLELRSKLDPAKLAPLVSDAATKLLASKDAAQIESGIKLVGAFKIADAEPALLAAIQSGTNETRDYVKGEPGHRTYFDLTPPAISALKALREMQSGNAELFERLAILGQQPEVRDEALAALATSKAADAPQRVLALYPKLAAPQRRNALDRLTTTKAGASAVVAAVTAGTLPKTDLDAAALDRLLAVLGDKDPALNALVESLGTLFRPVLALDGTDAAQGEDGITVDGPFTVETWIKLDEGIGNQDGILGAPGQLDINFYGGQFRVYVFPPLADVVVAKKPTVAGMWTHVTATRDAAGNWKAYIDGELSATGTKPSGKKLENVKLAWTSTAGGTKGQLTEFRVWKTERTADQIRANFDRGIPEGTADLVFNSDSKTGWGKLAPGAKIVKTTDLPPVLTADQAATLDAKFAKYTALAAKPGDKERGKAAAIVCSACHIFGNTGGQIGPNLSGVGAMGVDAILRNILTPNAAMESGYRIFRVEQRDGSVLDAFFVSEDKDAVIIRLPGAADQRIAKKDIVRTTFLRRSLMPEGLLDGMNDQQVSDLFAYLLSLK